MKKEILIYQSKSGKIEFRGGLKKNTVWGTQKQIADVFEIERSVVTKHIRKIIKDKEIDEKSNVQKMHFAHSDKPVKLYSLDIMLAVGYRANSYKAVLFRKWAVKTLKQELISKKQAADLFGQERIKDSVNGIVGNIFQTFGGQDLYSTIEEKSAHLLYFMVKNHPLIDGNKRSGAFSFIWFLRKAGRLPASLTPEALTALTLLVAESEPKKQRENDWFNFAVAANKSKKESNDIKKGHYRSSIKSLSYIKDDGKWIRNQLEI